MSEVYANKQVAGEVPSRTHEIRDSLLHSIERLDTIQTRLRRLRDRLYGPMPEPINPAGGPSLQQVPPSNLSSLANVINHDINDIFSLLDSID